jgi:hypothetical protein
MLRQAGSPADVLEIVRFDPGVLEAMREGGREDVGQDRAAEIPDRPPETRLFGSASDGSALVGATRRADRRIRADRRL